MLTIHLGAPELSHENEIRLKLFICKPIPRLLQLLNKVRSVPCFSLNEVNQLGLNEQTNQASLRRSIPLENANPNPEQSNETD